MSEKAFPAEETIYVAGMVVQTVDGPAVRSAYVMSANLSPVWARTGVLDQWKEHYPDYMAGHVAELKIRRALPTKKAIFWEGVAVGFCALPFVLIGLGVITRLVH